MERYGMTFEIQPGLPPAGERGQFLIQHSMYGWMLGLWNSYDSCFMAGTFLTSNDGYPLGQMVAFRDEQVPMAIQWTRLGD